jgi:hypothetical protein
VILGWLAKVELESSLIVIKLGLASTQKVDFPKKFVDYFQKLPF